MSNALCSMLQTNARETMQGVEEWREKLIFLKSKKPSKWTSQWQCFCIDWMTRYTYIYEEMKSLKLPRHNNRKQAMIIIQTEIILVMFNRMRGTFIKVDVFFHGRDSTKSIVDVTEEHLMVKSRFSSINTSDMLSNKTKNLLSKFYPSVLFGCIIILSYDAML